LKESNSKRDLKISLKFKKYGNLFQTTIGLIEGAQLLNSFIILFTLDKAEGSLLKSSDISKTISYNSLGHIYKPASTLKDLWKID
jgi:hypothetical protein